MGSDKNLPSRNVSQIEWVFLGLVSAALVLVLLFFGLFGGGLETDETCELRHHQTYDQEYRTAHPEHANTRIFPLSNKCNADYDMIPFWMNPLIVSLGLFSIGSVTLQPMRNIAADVARRRSGHR